MNIKMHTKEQAREFLKQEALKEISDVSDFTHFYRRVYHVIAKYGLQQKATKDELFSGDEWSNPACKKLLEKRIEQFLDIHIK